MGEAPMPRVMRHLARVGNPWYALAFIMPRETRHIPVLLDEVLRILDPRHGKIVVDCTLGLGGHSAALLERVRPAGKLIGIDFDPANIAIARSNLEAIDPAGESF